MSLNIKKLPEDIENEIGKFLFTDTIRIELLLDKYPLSKLDLFFKDFSIDQLDRVYKHGCVNKIFNTDDIYYFKEYKGYVCKTIRPKIKNLFSPILIHSMMIISVSCCPGTFMYEYWFTKNKKFQPKREEYIRNIYKFCDFILNRFEKDVIHRGDNEENFIKLGKKLVYDMLVGSLIMHKNMQFQKNLKYKKNKIQSKFDISYIEFDEFIHYPPKMISEITNNILELLSDKNQENIQFADL